MRQDFSHTGGRAIHTNAASGDLPPHGHDPRVDSLAACPPELPHHPSKERRAEYSCLMTGQENERGAPYSNFETNCPNVEKGKRATPSAGAAFSCFPNRQRGKVSICLILRKEDAIADTAYKEEYTYQIGKITFIVTPVYKDEGEPMRDILLKLMLADLEPA